MEEGIMIPKDFQKTCRIRISFEIFFSGPCEYPVVIQPHVRNASCTLWCSRNETAMYDVISANGSCNFISCTEGTSIELTIPIWITFVGSPFLTCTNDGWFPPVPKHDKLRNGKCRI